MSSKRGDYRHPKHDIIVRMVRAGGTNAGIAAEIKVDRRAVARIRELIGMLPCTNTTSPWDKLDRFSSEPDADGHVWWAGRRSRSGTPQIRHLGTEIPAAAVAFERRTLRSAVGTTRAECGVLHCVADAHVQDDLERRHVRMQLRAVYGLEPMPWDECPEGHSWDDHGRIEPDLTPYCRQCNTDRAARSRAARNEENGI